MPKRVEPDLGVMTLAAPTVTVLRPVVDQQQYSSIRNRIGEQVEQRLGPGVDPVQILEDDDQWLVEALAQQDALDRLQGAPLPYLRIHLGQRSGCFLDSEEREHVGQRVLETAVEHQHLAAHLLAPLA